MSTDGRSELWPGSQRAVLDPDDILTPAQLADRLKVSKSWVFEQTRSRAQVRNKNPLPYLRLGRFVRFSWKEVSEWINQNHH